MEDRKYHWENIYGNKQPHEVSWTQDVPETSLNFISSFNMHKKARIIDIGGGESKLVDFLLQEGYEDITVLDISEKALERAKSRLGDKACKITWIVSNILDFVPEGVYDVWHDRATFHFLTKPEQIITYLDTAANAVTGNMVIGTFSENGPLKCSGLQLNNIQKLSCKRHLKKTFRESIASLKII